MPEPRVAKIERRERQVGRGALIGLGVGFGVGLLTSHSQNSSGSSIVDAEGAGINLIGSTVLGTVVGAIVGAAAKVHRPVYEAPTPPKPASTESTQFRE